MIVRVASQIGRGFAMGAADVVPGVSGGTIALLLGIYDRLISNIREGAGALARLVRLDIEGAMQRLKRVEWIFLISLFVGIGMAVVLLVSWIRTQIDDHPVEVSAVFFGLVAASVIVAAREVSQWDVTRGLIAVAVAVVAFFVLGQRTGAVHDPSLAVVLVVGSVAICAMILPGISGSFILLMLGMYDHITEAVDERHLSTVAVFGVGAVIGLATFSTVLHWLLEHHRDTVMAALIGLMAGSLRVLWPWPADAVGESTGLENVELAAPVADEIFAAIVGALVAAAVVVVLGEIGRRHDTAR